MAKFFITGGAGFIGSHLVDHALKNGHEVMVFDDFSTGREEFLSEAKKSSQFSITRGDIREFDQLDAVLQKFRPDWTIHFAANADVRKGLERPRRDLDYNTIGTWNVAETSRRAHVKNILFSSTGSVYGEPEVFPTPETCPFPTQTSLYGASKVAGEAILSSYAIGYGMNVTVFRFVSILGPRYTHGHVFDFVRALKKNPEELRILGNGKQLKSYLHVEDLIRGIWLVIEKNNPGFQVYNIGHDEALTVDTSIGYITSELKLNPARQYTGGERGWIGDSPRIQLDTKKLKSLGWSYRHSLEIGVRDTVKFLMQNEKLLNEVQ